MTYTETKTTKNWPAGKDEVTHTLVKARMRRTMKEGTVEVRFDSISPLTLSSALFFFCFSWLLFGDIDRKQAPGRLFRSVLSAAK